MKLKSFQVKGSLLRTIIYTIGHMLISILCVVTITGSDVRLATVESIIEPLINAFWYFLLDYLWTYSYNGVGDIENNYE